MVDICKSLLKEPMLEDAIRAGDCLAMLVEHYHAAGRMEDAYEHLRDMESRSIALHPYVDAQILEEVFRAVGADEGRGAARPVKNREIRSSDDSRSEMKQGSSSDKAPLKNSSHPSSTDDADIDSDIEEDMGDTPDPSSRSKKGSESKPQQTSHRGASTASSSSSKRAAERDGRDRSNETRGRGSGRREEEEEEGLDEAIDEVQSDISFN
jgi:hypothetical protein